MVRLAGAEGFAGWPGRGRKEEAKAKVPARGFDWAPDGIPVAFLALSVNFLQLVSGWTGKERRALEGEFHRLRPWRFLRVGVGSLLLIEPVKF